MHTVTEKTFVVGDLVSITIRNIPWVAEIIPIPPGSKTSLLHLRLLVTGRCDYYAETEVCRLSQPLENSIEEQLTIKHKELEKDQYLKEKIEEILPKLK